MVYSVRVTTFKDILLNQLELLNVRPVAFNVVYKRVALQRPVRERVLSIEIGIVPDKVD